MESSMKKPRLSFWQIWNMSFGFLGIQFGFALQNANVSRIFETFGASIDNIPILWIAAPVTGLIVQPIIGHMSDKTWNRLGRQETIFFSWSNTGIDRNYLYAKLPCPVDCSWNVMDNGCFHKYFHGTIQSFCW